MFLNISHIGDWLGNKLSANAEELKDDDLQNMTKAELITSIKELQAKYKQSVRTSQRLSDGIMKVFLNIK